MEMISALNHMKLLCLRLRLRAQYTFGPSIRLRAQYTVNGSVYDIGIARFFALCSEDFIHGQSNDARIPTNSLTVIL